MRNNAIILGLSLVWLFPASQVLAGAGTTSGVTLVQPSGSRAIAMGEAFTAVCNDVFAANYNPAANASAGTANAAMFYLKGFADDSFGSAGIYYPSKIGVFSAGLSYYSVGTIELIDYYGNERNVHAQADTLFVLGYARQIGRFSAGVRAKYLSSRLVEEYKGTARLFDAGIGFRLNKALVLGASTLNMGSSIRYIETSEKLPLAIRGGVAWEAYKIWPVPLLVTFDLVKQYQEDIKGQAGLEYTISKLFKLRAGYKSGSGWDGLAGGFGIEYNRFAIDYSYTNSVALGNVQSFTLGVKL